jgi:ketosteroid isomerase-like protein
MTVKEIGSDIVDHVRMGKDWEAVKKHYSADIVSMEASGETASGLDALKAKHEGWSNEHEVHGVEAEGPFVNGDFFTTIYVMDVTHRPSGQRFHMKEVGLYKVVDGKVAEERFFYNM